MSERKRSKRGKIVAVRLPVPVYNKLKEKADAQGAPVSEVLRYFILKYVGVFEKNLEETEEVEQG